MRQMENTVTYIFLYVTCASIYSFADDVALDEPLMESDFEIVRLPHDLDLGKRVYGYPSQYKRYPLYNFGLGKRSHLYNFGLGKRSGFDEDNIGVEEYEEYNDDDEQIPELELYQDDSMQNINKRQKLYNFGLGKRQRYNFGLGKRTQRPRYDFGLGKRQQPAISKDKLYNFGLGKRNNHLYSFGLGKRPYNQGPVPGRFNFGLGKRSEDFDVTKNIVAKRDVHDQMLPETETEKMESNQKSNLEKVNKTAELESHEIMGHSGKSQLSKRSSYRYAFEPGKPVSRSNSEFSRQFRKPMYNFGLGKRMSLADENNVKNFSEN